MARTFVAAAFVLALIASPPPAVAEPDFTLSLTPVSLSVEQGTTAIYTVNVDRIDGFTGAVTLSANPAAPGTSFSPNPVTGSSSTLSAPIASNAPPGTYPFTVTGTSGSLVRTASGSLTVTASPSPDFTLSLTPVSLSVEQGTTAIYTVSVDRVNGFTGAVTLSADPVSPGTFFSPNPVAGSESTLSSPIAADASPGTYPFTVTGTSGSLVRTVTGSLTVTPGSSPGFTLSLTPASQSVSLGATATVTINIDRVGGFADAVTLAVEPPVPSDATVSPNPATGNSATITGTVPPDMPLGTYPFTVTGTSGSLTRSATGEITVVDEVPPPALPQPRARHSASLLADGTVLLAGGSGPDGTNLASALRFDPATETFTALSGALNTPRRDHAAVLLPGTSVLHLAGADPVATDTAELFEPGSGSFSPLAAAAFQARAGHTATLLLDGRVLILGGADQATAPLDSSEAFDARPDPFSAAIFDPATGVFTPLPHALAEPRSNHTATLLPSGLVLVAGGTGPSSELASAELFDPESGTSTLLPAQLGQARQGHTATLRPDGNVLLAGGVAAGTVLSSLEVFDPATLGFTTLPATLATPRTEHTASQLPSGKILLAGGIGPDGPLATTEQIDPLPDTAVPQLMASLPGPGAVDVVLNALVGVRFSEPVRAASVNAATVRLVGPQGDVPGTAGIAEGGLYAFFLPQAPLAPGETYTLRLEGVVDLAGNALPLVLVSFMTAGEPQITGFDPDHGVAHRGRPCGARRRRRADPRRNARRHGRERRPLHRRQPGPRARHGRSPRRPGRHPRRRVDPPRLQLHRPLGRFLRRNPSRHHVRLHRPA
jgi:hypothetical protein